MAKNQRGRKSMKNKEEEREQKNNMFWELHEYLDRAGYFEASEEEKKKIWKRIAKMWNLKDKNA